jgi:hypothetical protein
MRRTQTSTTAPARWRASRKFYITALFILIMAIKPICDKCKKELQEFGAILFSPPDKESNVKKFHVCKECYQEIISEFK